MKKIAIAGFHHETNTFAPGTVGLIDFEQADGWPAMSEGAAILDNFKNKNIPISGFIEAAGKQDWKLCPVLWCNAPPGGYVEKDAYETIAGKIVDGIATLGAIDGIYLDLHGAMVSQMYPDGEGELLRRIRNAVGGDVPIVVSLDLHANVSQMMVDNADILVGFKTYPHVDMAETGAKAVSLLSGLLKENAKHNLIKRHKKLPFLISISSQCTLVEPAKGVMDLVRTLEAKPGISSASFCLGFPPADTPECGPSLLVYGDDEATVTKACNELYDKTLAQEAEFNVRIWKAQEAVHHAVASGIKTIVLADTHDNPGAGAKGDSVDILYQLVKQGAKNAVVASICDVEAAALAHRCGKGKELLIELGDGEEGPFVSLAKVQFLGEGRVLSHEGLYAGSEMEYGKTALLDFAGVRAIVTSNSIQTADTAILKYVGINPKKCNIIVVKSSVHFRAVYEDLAAEICVVGASGSNLDDPSQFSYKQLRKGVRLRPQTLSTV